MIVGRGAGVILIDEQNKVLLQHRDNKASWDPGHWGIFGGQIEKGETPGMAAKRELKEELGIELNDLNFFKRYDVKRKGGIYEAFFFTAPLTIPVEKLKTQQIEGQGLDIFSFNEIRDLKLMDVARMALDDFFNQS